MTFTQYCKETAIDLLENLKDQEKTFMACDFGFELTMDINNSCSVTNDREKDKQYLLDFASACGDYWEYQKMAYGEVFANPFDDPEKYFACMVIDGVRGLLAECSIILENWDEELFFNNGLIMDLIGEIKQVDDYKRLF